MDSTQRFTNRVKNYVQFRPSYPAEAIDFMFDKLGMSNRSIVADIGSGTGKLTELLADRVAGIYAVEPNDAMRQAAEGLLSGKPGCHSVAAGAEQTTLPDCSIDFITVAQAFHWFDREKCKAEFSRILKPGGSVILLYNSRDEEDRLQRDYEKLIRSLTPEYDKVSMRQLSDADYVLFFHKGFEKKLLENSQKFDLSGLIGRTLSSSYSPLKGEPNHQKLMEGLRELYAQYENNGFVSFKYKTEIIWGAL